MGGTETYVRELLRAFSEHPGITVTTFVNRAATGVLPAAREVVASHVSGGQSARHRIASLGRGLLPDARSRAELGRQDLLHYPFTVPLPRVGAVPWIMSLHDVQHLDLPHMFTAAERAYRRVAYDLPARRAPMVMTLSEFSRQRIVEHLGIPRGRVVVTPLGVDTSAFTPYDGPREPLVLYPATAWPHKNHARLVRAMERVRRSVPDLRLVLTGGRLETLGNLPEWVDRRGHVPAEELRDLYRSAACLAFPSLYEGFGLPVLEAMASGCPVAASDRGPLPELCGDVATLFDPEDEEAMAQGILTTLRDGEGLAHRGVGRAAAFTWSRCAETHLAAYRRMTRA
jgi:glycosyltransferase involved in cell wall biosynthesis